MRTAIMCGALIALTVTAVRAEEDDLISANKLLPYCKKFIAGTDYSSFESGFCAGQVTAAGTMFARLKLFQPTALCADIPTNASVEQIIRVVIRYIEARPNLMHGKLFDLAVLALGDAWPCKK